MNFSSVFILLAYFLSLRAPEVYISRLFSSLNAALHIVHQVVYNHSFELFF